MTLNQSNQSLFQIMLQHGGHTLPIIHCTKNTFLQISHTLETVTLSQPQPFIVFAGLQQSLHWYDNAPRFNDLAKKATLVYLFTNEKPPSARHGTKRYIELIYPSPLLQSWFLLIVSESFSVLLCSTNAPATHLINQNHEVDVLLTFDHNQITHALTFLEEAIIQQQPDEKVHLQEFLIATQSQNPDGALISQIMTSLLNYDFLAYRELQQQSILLETMMFNTKQCSYIVQSYRDGRSILRSVFGDPEKLLGYTWSELSDPLSLSDKILHPEDKPRFYAKLPTLVPNTIYSDDYRYIHKDGHIILLRITTRTVEYGDGWMHYGTLQDVSFVHEAEQVRMAKKLVEDELDNQKDINKANLSLLDSVIYDVRDPLTIILLASQTLERDKNHLNHEEVQTHLKTIQAQVLQVRATLDEIRSDMSSKTD